jgi:ribosomal protein S18 acetylase RimI-like enzyme
MAGSPAVDQRITVRRVTEADWPRLRAVRLEMLADTPSAYLETVADATARTEEEWRSRVRRMSAGTTDCALAAEPEGGGPWVAYMACFLDGPGRVHLVSVYVAPAHRGTGLAERMVAEMRRWARDEARVATMHLYVHEDNPRARAFYRRLGFAETGDWLPYELNPLERDLEMELSLGPDPPG